MTVQEREWITCAETAKLVRGALKREFPGVKFSVRSSNYSGGASITVRWTDGPTTRAVDAVTNDYAGGRFDGQIDLKYHAQHWLTPDGVATIARVYGHSYSSENDEVTPDPPAGARLVHFAADYIFTERDISDELAAAVGEQAHEQEHGDIDYCKGCGRREELRFWIRTNATHGLNVVLACSRQCVGKAAADQGVQPVPAEQALLGIPYATAAVDNVGLYRICPECETHVREFTDEHGEQTSNRYAEHFAAEHPHWLR